MKKSKSKRVDENRMYPCLANLIEVIREDSAGKIVSSRSTEEYVKNYFQINKGAPFGNHMPIRFVPCTYLIGDKEFIA